MPFEDLPKPADYTIKTVDPAEAVRKNVELVTGIAQMQQNQQLHNLQAQEIQQKISMQQTAQNRQQMLNQDMSALGSNPTTLDIARLSGKYPELKDHFKATFDMLSATEKESATSLGQKVYNALNTGAPDIAAKTAAEAAEAFRNHNQPDKADAMDNIAKMAEKNPGGAKFAIGTFLTHAMGAEEFQKMMLTPAEVRAKAAAATTAETTARHSEEAATDTHLTSITNRYQATGAGLLSRAGADKDRQEIALNDKLNPNKIASSNIALDLEKAAAPNIRTRDRIATNAAGPLSDAAVLQAQGAAQQSQINTEMLKKYGMSNAAADAFMKDLTAKNAKRSQNLELTGKELDNQKKQVDLNYSDKDHQIAQLTALKTLGTPNTYVQKRTEELSTKAGEAARSANTADNLVEQLKGASYVGGSPTAVLEYFKRHLGRQDVSSILQKQVAQYNNQDLLAMFPPGGRLNQDIIHQMKDGIFDPTTNPAAAAEAIRVVGLKKRADATLANAEKQFVEINQTTGSAKMDGMINVNGLVVPYTKGEDFNDILTNKVMPHIPQIAGGSARPLSEDEVAKFRQAMAKHPKSAKALADTLREHGEDPNG